MTRHRHHIVHLLLTPTKAACEQRFPPIKLATTDAKQVTCLSCMTAVRELVQEVR